MRGVLPPFHFSKVNLHLDPCVAPQNLFTSFEHSDIKRPGLGTDIWWAHFSSGNGRCLKEFSQTDPAQFKRQIPDPIWDIHPLPGQATGAQRGLLHERARLFDQLLAGTLQQKIQEHGIGYKPFLQQFNTYSFEVEALVTQFARHYGCDRLVQAYGWGPMTLRGADHPRNVIEMERLQELPPPPVITHSGHQLLLVDRLLDMMMAVTQLHSMLIPLRNYPPELVRKPHQVRNSPIVRPFHYDLSPDQFLQRPGQGDQPDRVVLIDFNASRADQAEYSTFSWQTIPGKNYYQPPERRNTQAFHDELHFRSDPIYDLYSLLVIGMFYLRRSEAEEAMIRQIKGWHDLAYFYTDIFDPQLRNRLLQQLNAYPSTGIVPEPLVAAWTATFQKNPEARIQSLRHLLDNQWLGSHDWTLVPRVMDFLARRTMQRSLRMSWKQRYVRIEQGTEPSSIHEQIDWDGCHWQVGHLEEGRIDHPDFVPEELFFFQQEPLPPLTYRSQIDPYLPGTRTIYCAFGGCVDFDAPLTLEVVPRPRRVQVPESPSRLRSERETHEIQTPLTEHPSSTRTTSRRQTRKIEQAPNPQRVFPSDKRRQTKESRAPEWKDEGSSFTSESTSPELATTQEYLSPQSENSNEHLGKLELKAIDFDQWQETLISEQHQATYILQSLQTAQTIDEIEALEIQIQQLSQTTQPRLWMQALSQRGAVLLRQHQLHPEDQMLVRFSQHLTQLPPQSMTYGFFLNNLTVCCYESAYQYELVPDWHHRLGYDPYERLQQWLAHTDAEQSSLSPFLWKLRAHAWETITYCEKLRWRWAQ